MVSICSYPVPYMKQIGWVGSFDLFQKPVFASIYQYKIEVILFFCSLPKCQPQLYYIYFFHLTASCFELFQAMSVMSCYLNIYLMFLLPIFISVSSESFHMMHSAQIENIGQENTLLSHSFACRKPFYFSI